MITDCSLISSCTKMITESFPGLGFVCHQSYKVEKLPSPPHPIKSGEKRNRKERKIEKVIYIYIMHMYLYVNIPAILYNILIYIFLTFSFSSFPFLTACYWVCWQLLVFGFVHEVQ